MKKDLGIVPAVYPMPVLMVAAYDESGRVNDPHAIAGNAKLQEAYELGKQI
jgi:hypothetical protein